MIFRACAQVSNDDISNAIEQVNTHCTEENIQKFLAQWDPWKKNQRLLQVKPYDQLPEKKVACFQPCVINQCETEEMVLLDNFHIDYDAFVTNYVVNGRHPATNLTMTDWPKDIVRLTKEDSSLN